MGRWQGRQTERGERGIHREAGRGRQVVGKVSRERVERYTQTGRQR